jgi:hypothetical protein
VFSIGFFKNKSAFLRMKYENHKYMEDRNVLVICPVLTSEKQSFFSRRRPLSGFSMRSVTQWARIGITLYRIYQPVVGVVRYNEQRFKLRLKEPVLSND